MGELEVTSRDKVSEYERQRQEAQVAIVAAKKALEEVKMKEKETAAAAKNALIEQREKDAALLKGNKDIEADADNISNKDPLAAQKAAEKNYEKEWKQIEKMRMAREKERQVIFREAAGLIKTKSHAKRALMNAPHDAGAPTSKSAK